MAAAAVVDLYDVKADAEAGAPRPLCAPLKMQIKPQHAGVVPSGGGPVSCRWGQNCRLRSLAKFTRALSVIMA